MATLGNVTLVNSREDESVNVNVTTHPVESGAPISDHVQQQNKTVQISGFLIGNSAEADFRRLEENAQKGTIVTYKGRIYLKDVLISNVSRGYQNIQNGMEVVLALTTVRRAKTSWVKRTTSVGTQQPTQSQSSAVHVTVKRGDTYWGWSMRYGTSIAQLRTWNGWPDRLIPIGVRARVK